MTAFPMLNGALPILGHLPEMYRSFPQLCARGARAHGPLFMFHGGPGARQLMCTAPEGLVALKHPATSTSFYGEGFGALLSGTLFSFDGSEHRDLRGVMAPAFTPAALSGTNVMEIIADTSARAIEGWIDADRVQVLPATKDMALEIIFRLLGARADDLPAWRRHYGRYLWAGLPSTGRFRGPLHWMASRARDWLDARLGDIVDEWRRRDDTTTLVGAIANSRDEDGVMLERALVVANLRLLILAGHETTASTLAYNLLELAQDERLQGVAMEDVGGSEDDPLSVVADRGRFSFGETLFWESLRLYPAVHSVIRRVTEDFELVGETIPRGTLLNVPLVHLLRDPARWEEPVRFRPERWKERPKPGSIAAAMFGGGPHFCLGYHLAVAEGTIFNLQLAQALRRRGKRMVLDGAPSVPRPIYLPLTHPPSAAAIGFR